MVNSHPRLEADPLRSAIFLSQNYSDEASLPVLGAPRLCKPHVIHKWPSIPCKTHKSAFWPLREMTTCVGQDGTKLKHVVALAASEVGRTSCSCLTSCFRKEKGGGPGRCSRVKVDGTMSSAFETLLAFRRPTGFQESSCS